jgi:AraC-like DNA-binding protein
MNGNFDHVNLATFFSKYTRNREELLDFIESPIQIYPLSIAKQLIPTPARTFRADYNFLLIFTAGGGLQQLNNDRFQLNKNDVLFIREGHLNAIEEIHDGTDGFFIYFENAVIPLLFEDSELLNRLAFYPKTSLEEKSMVWLNECCNLLFKSDNQDGVTDPIRIALLKSIILKISESNSSILTSPDRKTEVALRFKHKLYSEFKENRDVSFYADFLSTSDNYLYRCVKSVTGKNPKEHINNAVIGHSKVLLQDARMQISEIAFQLNFNDPSYFGRLFKQIVGITPSEYRDQFRQDLSYTK